jgi:hypothetical protein
MLGRTVPFWHGILVKLIIVEVHKVEYQPHVGKELEDLLQP